MTDLGGLFWTDTAEQAKARRQRAQTLPPVPRTAWARPKTFPCLRAARALAIDVETYDPELLTHGPGWARGVGHIVGISVATNDGWRGYFPMRHEIEGELNFRPQDVLAWAKNELTRKEQPKIGANIKYDLGWLRQEGVHVKGKLYDIQYAAALLSEYEDTNLEYLAQKHLGKGKESSILYEWLAAAYGGKANSGQRKNIYRAPASLVGLYAESDVTLPLEIIAHQWKLLHEQGLLHLQELENGLTPLLIDMRFAGVPVDVAKAEEVRETLIKEEVILQKKVDSHVGFSVGVNAGASLAKAFDKLGLIYPTTEKGAPSFRKDFLKGIKHPFAEDVKDLRELQKTRSTFVEGAILNKNVKGYVYPEFNPLRGGSEDDDSEYGTRYGRFSASNPNYQQQTARHKRFAALLRGLTVPDRKLGHVQWRKYDFSQIQYRLLAHYATGQGADELREKYRIDPKTDYHNVTLEMAAPVAGWDISTEVLYEERRRPIKNLNFGLLFTMGIDKTAQQLGISVEDAQRISSAYHEALPFVKHTTKAFIRQAEETGIIKTILNRRTRFDLFVPYEFGEKGIPLPYEEAVRYYGRVKRAYTHKSLCNCLAGSEGDLMKTAMLQCYTDGVFGVTGLPRLTVHDEIGFSDSAETNEAFDEVHRILENCIKLRVPVITKCSIGANWGACK